MTTGMTKTGQQSKSQPNTAVAVTTFGEHPTLRKWLDSPDIKAGLRESLAGFMDAGPFVGSLLTSFQKPEIQACTPKSQLKIIHDLAAVQLLPIHQHVALIPRNMAIKDESGRNIGTQAELTMMIQWQGFQAIMLRHPEVEDVKATIIHTKTDTYRFDEETETIVDHKYDPLDPNRVFKNFDDVRGGYLTIYYRDKSRPKKHHIVHVNEMRKASACAQSRKFWDAWFHEMVLKTIFRNAYGRRAVPVDPLVHAKIQKAFDLEDEFLGNDPSRVIESKPVAQTLGGPKPSRSEAALARMTHSSAPVEDQSAGETQGQTTTIETTAVQQTEARSEQVDREPGDDSNLESQVAQEQASQAQQKSAPKTQGKPAAKNGKGQTRSLMSFEDVRAEADQIQTFDDLERVRELADRTEMSDTQRRGLNMQLDMAQERLQGEAGQ